MEAISGTLQEGQTLCGKKKLLLIHILLYLKDAMDYAAESRQSEIVEDLMKFFLNEELNDCFSALLYKCYDLLRPYIVLELAWRYNIVNYAMPFMIQSVRDFGFRVWKHV